MTERRNHASTVSRVGPATPLYEQVSRAIEDLALSRALSDDSPLPPEAELMRRFGVSRGTVRRAVELLEQRGLVSREVGRGTYVNPVARLRRIVWQRLRDVAVPDSRFGLDFEAFVPDYEGSDQATARLLQLDEYRDAQVVVIAPDNNLVELRERACADGKRVLVPTYGIRRGFVLLEDVAPADRALGATLDGLERVGQRLSLEQLAAIRAVDLAVTGAAAVTTGGVLFGKGHGFFDLEWGILRELGLAADSTPVIASVHDCQVVDEAVDPKPYDCTVDRIVTPTRSITCERPAKPPGILWDRVDTATVAAIPYLAELMLLPPSADGTRPVNGLARRVRVSVDADACMATGECQHELPGLFGIGDGGIVELLANPEDFDRESVDRAVAACPNFALGIAGGVEDG